MFYETYKIAWNLGKIYPLISIKYSSEKEIV